MKIKEVIEQTGLTDRAVRLYIDSGLLNPSITESYSGRKSIDFTETDVQKLQNIALLRKAGFSIESIRGIIENNGTKDIIEGFIAEAEADISYKTEIVEKLKNISLDDNVTIEEICASLSATVEESEIPSEDVKLTAKEAFVKGLSIFLSGGLLLFSALLFIGGCRIIFDFRYISLNTDEYFMLPIHACWLVLMALSIIVLRRSTGRRYIKNARSKRKIITAALLALSLAGCVLLTPVSFITLAFAGGPMYSHTTDVDNYLEFDKRLEEAFDEGYDDLPIYKVFPRTIPSSAEDEDGYPDTTKYHYLLTDCVDSYGYGSYEIFAEWVLSPAEYERAKSELPGDIGMEEYIFQVSQLEASDEEKDYLINSAQEHNDYTTETNGDWTITFYRKTEGKLGHSYLIAAYNDKEQKMRYIASFCCAHHSSESEPFYLTLDW